MNGLVSLEMLDNGRFGLLDGMRRRRPSVAAGRWAARSTTRAGARKSERSVVEVGSQRSEAHLRWVDDVQLDLEKTSGLDERRLGEEGRVPGGDTWGLGGGGVWGSV